MRNNRGQDTLRTIRRINKELIAALSLIHGEVVPTKIKIEPGTNDAVSYEACNLYVGQCLQVITQVMPKPHLR